MQGLSPLRLLAFACSAMFIVVGALALEYPTAKRWARAQAVNARVCAVRRTFASLQREFLDANSELRSDRTVSKLFNEGVSAPICDRYKSALDDWRPWLPLLSGANRRAFDDEHASAPEPSVCTRIEDCDDKTLEPLVEWFDASVSGALPSEVRRDPAIEKIWSDEVERVRRIAPLAHRQLELDQSAICSGVRDLQRSRKISLYDRERAKTSRAPAQSRKVAELSRAQESRLRHNLDLFMLKWTRDPSVRPSCLNELNPSSIDEL